ncbi:RNA-binding protein [Bacillus aerolatus]|uniref:RNA-binding protein n=1 Tax=Bacillus aerolatus TaxID=2653354 RepID=A0A6I1FNF4_9BACI|nr:RNA-binding protein [Bacillus aerolatus]KAB7707984.1 RNA-binding protein [Bacillus aerolatus]
MSSIYQHFRPEEKEFIDQVLEWKRESAEMYAPKLTDFLDPREQEIVRAVVGTQDESAVAFFGGTVHSERKRAYICPAYFTPEDKDFEIALYEVSYPDKFVSISHPHVLGSLMGLGLRRGKFGDILTDGKRFQFLAAEEVGSYIELNFNQVGKTPVTLNKVSFDQAFIQEEEWREASTTVSSLRLDAILSAFTKQSRQKVQALIKGGLVKVNWKQVENPAFECTEGDVFSVRGAGRAKLLTIEGKTKKEKWRIILGIIK